MTALDKFLAECKAGTGGLSSGDAAMVDKLIAIVELLIFGSVDTCKMIKRLQDFDSEEQDNGYLNTILWGTEVALTKANEIAGR